MLKRQKRILKDLAVLIVNSIIPKAVIIKKKLFIFLKLFLPLFTIIFLLFLIKSMEMLMRSRIKIMLSIMQNRYLSCNIKIGFSIYNYILILVKKLIEYQRFHFDLVLFNKISIFIALYFIFSFLYFVLVQITLHRIKIKKLNIYKSVLCSIIIY